VQINLGDLLFLRQWYEDAKEYYGKAALVDAEKAKEYAYLAERAVEGARAAEERDPSKDILFAEE
jgi:uncharacterized protein HemY